MEAYIRVSNWALISFGGSDAVHIYVIRSFNISQRGPNISYTIIWSSKRIILSIFAFAISKLFCFKADIASSFFFFISYTFLFLYSVILFWAVITYVFTSIGRTGLDIWGVDFGSSEPINNN